MYNIKGGNNAPAAALYTYVYNQYLNLYTNGGHYLMLAQVVYIAYTPLGIKVASLYLAISVYNT